MACPFCNSGNTRTISVWERTGKRIILEVKCRDCHLKFYVKLKPAGPRWTPVSVRLKPF